MRALRNFKPDRCYHLISRSANFFTARYLSPLEKAGLIRISGKADRFSPHKLFELTARGRRLANGQPHH